MFSKRASLSIYGSTFSDGANHRTHSRGLQLLNTPKSTAHIKTHVTCRTAPFTPEREEEEVEDEERGTEFKSKGGEEGRRCKINGDNQRERHASMSLKL